MIYLDNAATTMKKPRCVIDAVLSAMQSMGNAGRGAHEATLKTSRTVYEARCLLAEFFNAEDPQQVVFTCNSTEALNIAIKGVLNPGDHVITTMLEHNSVLRPLYEMEKKGISLSFVKADREGNPDYAEFESLIRPETRAIITARTSREMWWTSHGWDRLRSVTAFSSSWTHPRRWGCSPLMCRR